jgi:Insertion element 4 transposase N-terminal
MVYFTLALALFQQDSYDDVAEHMVGGVPELSESIPDKSSFSRARQRLGAQAIERVFRKLTGPLGPPLAWRDPSTAGCGWPPWTDSSWTLRRPRRTGGGSAGRRTRAGRWPGSPR